MWKLIMLLNHHWECLMPNCPASIYRMTLTHVGFFLQKYCIRESAVTLLPDTSK